MIWSKSFLRFIVQEEKKKSGRRRVKNWRFLPSERANAMCSLSGNTNLGPNYQTYPPSYPTIRGQSRRCRAHFLVPTPSRCGVAQRGAAWLPIAWDRFVSLGVNVRYGAHFVLVTFNICRRDVASRRAYAKQRSTGGEGRGPRGFLKISQLYVGSETAATPLPPGRSS